MRKLILLFATVFILSSDGLTQNFNWAKSMGGGFESGYSINRDKWGNVYTTGFFNGEVDFDPGEDVYNLRSGWTFTRGYDSDIFISKLDSQGNFVWAIKVGWYGQDYGHSITTDTFGNIYLTGYFEGTVDFDPSQKVYNLSSKGYWDIFVLKLDSSGNLDWARSFGECA